MINAGIYIHFPFCNKKCNYCDYFSIEKSNYDLELFTKFLIKEINLSAPLCKNNWIFDTIYFGGGSPGLLNHKDFDLILNKLFNKFNFSTKVEITIEVNPGENSLNDFIEFKKIGVNRLSLGIQTLNPTSLQLLTRDHFTTNYFKTYFDAIDAGLTNINIDLLYNIPGQTIKSWIEDVKSIIQINPSHISIISLILEPEVRLNAKLKDQSIPFNSSETEEEMYREGVKELQKSNYLQYEVGHFAKDKMQSRHSLHYWNLDPYIGLGPSANSYNGLQRWCNVKSLDEYIHNLKNSKLPISNYEILSKIDKYNEKIINGLRTNRGVYTNEIKEIFITHTFQESLNKWRKYLYISSNTISLKKEYFYLTDEIITDFLIDNSIS